LQDRVDDGVQFLAMVENEGIDLGIKGLGRVSLRLVWSAWFKGKTYDSEVAELLQGRVHAFLHDEELLLLFFYSSSQIAVLNVQLVKQFVDLNLLRLSKDLAMFPPAKLTRSESSSSVNCRLYLAMTVETSELLLREESSARSLANARSLLKRSSSSR
jgi:hypothetical protein